MSAPERGARRRFALQVALRSAQIAAATAAALGVFAGALLRGREPLRPRLERAAGRALVHLATSLGATFIKVGQIASTRADLVPGPLRAELLALQDRVPPFGFDAVREIVERDLGNGRTLEEIFAEFDPTPVAAASVAQVHRARLPGSAAIVAVKVRRPDILEKVHLDRAILLFVSRALERLVPTIRLISLEGAMVQFCQAVEEQIHLSNEAAHNLRFRENFDGDPDITFPRLVPGLCSDSVLTMEFIEAVREEDLEAQGVEVRRVVEAGMRAVCRMIFLHGFVHADLHPGNVRFRAPHEIVFLDLGLVGRLADEERRTTARLLFAFATGDGPTVARLFYDNAPYRGTRDYAAYEAEIVTLVDDLRSRGLANMQVTLEIGRIFDILRRHRIQAKSHMTMVNLALMTAEGLAKRLAPELSLTDEALPYLAEALGVPDPRGRAASA